MSATATSEIRRFFATEPRYKFAKLAGAGGSGIALSFRDDEAEPGGFPRFVVKTVVLATTERLATRLNGYKSARKSAPEQWPVDSVPKPYMIIEYVENGTINSLMQMQQKCRAARLPGVSNRVLWAIFWYLARTCVAMAAPPPPIPNPRLPKYKRREVVPDNTSDLQVSNLIHSDMNLGNNPVVFGHRLSEFLEDEPTHTGEHDLVPILKLIDFSNEREVTEPKMVPRATSFDRRLCISDRRDEDLKKLLALGKDP
ncbi:hypothetical protein F5Y03DRAFT_399763 [Xylaria venustula]|nr:hypothetical protein F5Y03DRAFT_399763 [Xylaria venustula]